MKLIKEEYTIKDFTLSVLAVSIVWGFLIIGSLIILGIGAELDQKDRLMMIQQIVNFTWAGAGLALGYYFGSSKSGSDKDKAISDLAAGTGGPTATIKKDSDSPAEEVPLMAVVNAEETVLKTKTVRDAASKTLKKAVKFKKKSPA